MSQRICQKGFTLIEAAIVLVIIGLLIGGVLKGQELINSSKIKQAITDMNGVATAYNAYFDEYRRQPGDDGPLATLQGRGSSWQELPTEAFGNLNGIIDASSNATFTGSGEGGYFWNHLKAAQLMSGDIAASNNQVLPLNSFGGRIGVTNGHFWSLAGNKICLSEIPGRAAAAIDRQIDDGRPNSGSLRAAEAVSGAHTPPGGTLAISYNEDKIYTICRRL